MSQLLTVADAPPMVTAGLLNPLPAMVATVPPEVGPELGFMDVITGWAPSAPATIIMMQDAVMWIIRTNGSLLCVVERYAMTAPEPSLNEV